MMDHVSITVNDWAASAAFYDAIMAALGLSCVWRRDDAIGYGERDLPGYVNILQCPGVVADRRHRVFRAADRATVRAFHAVGLGAGGRDDGAPRLCLHHHAAFLLGPEAGRFEAVCHLPCPG